jgi:hypothetical protein
MGDGDESAKAKEGEMGRGGPGDRKTEGQDRRLKAQGKRVAGKNAEWIVCGVIA